MKLPKRRLSIVQLQWLIWIAVLFIVFFTYLPEDGFYQAAAFASVNVAFYIILIYGNITFLFPRFYEKGNKLLYAILALILLIGGGFARGYIIMYMDIHFFAEKPMPMTLNMFVYFILAGILTFLLSFIFRIAIAYFALKQQSEKILAQKSQAELNLLKSQVQPHFLFNTLNNIYYEAYREAPRTAKLIERLSDIMRYFVDESPKEEVSINTEVQFLENYIALEKIRVRHEIELSFVKDYSKELRLPPMLLMTFIENIFKHGIDKASNINKIDVSLTERDGYLLFETRNRLFEKAPASEHRGFGIENLRKRLNLLYGNNFELKISHPGDYFTAFLKVPVS
ncbi:MAG TPA: histidine kinase [Mucilaginibacter sp.]|nr:histidine kinase [Mucilaginibacter sp.]